MKHAVPPALIAVVTCCLALSTSAEFVKTDDNCLSMARTVAAAGYMPGATLEIAVTISGNCGESLTALGLIEEIPAGWTLVSAQGGASGEAGISPTPGASSPLEFAWFSPIPTFPHTFSYTLKVPENFAGETVISGKVLGRLTGPELRSPVVETLILEIPQDTEPPLVSFNGPSEVVLECDGVYEELGAAAVDNVDGELPVTISGIPDTGNVGDYEVVYAATDRAGNTGTATRTVHVVDTQSPTLELMGAETVELSTGDVYTEPGYTAADACEGDLTGDVQISGTVDTALPGVYLLEYAVVDVSGNAASATRTVRVLLNSAPVITLNGEATVRVECGGIFADPGATALDAEDGDLTGDITVEGTVNTGLPGEYALTYRVTDSRGLASETVRTVLVEDTLPPVINLLGDNPLTLDCGALFAEPGVTATDACDGDLAVISDTKTIGTSTQTTVTVLYSARDSSGNVATATRTVHVSGPSCGAPDEYCPMTDIDILRPVGDVFMPYNVDETGVTLNARVLFADTADCIFGTVRVVYDLNGTLFGPSEDRANNFPETALLAAGEYTLTVSAEQVETGETITATTSFSVLHGGVNENGYLDAPFETLSNDGDRFDNRVADSLFDRTIVLVAAFCPEEGGGAGDIFVTASPAHNPAQTVTVRVPRPVIPCGQQAIITLTLSDTLEGLLGGDGAALIPEPPAGRISTGLFFDLSILLADIADVVDGGGVTYRELDDGVLADNPVDISMNGLAFTPGLHPAYLSHPTAFFADDAADLNLAAEPGTWTDTHTGGFTVEGDTLSGRVTALSLFAPFERRISLSLWPDTASGVVFGRAVIGESLTKSFTLTNTGDVPMKGAGSIDGDATAFVLCCPGPYHLGPGESVSINVKFTPCKPGDYAACLNISGDPEGVLSVRLLGTGTCGPKHSLLCCAPSGGGHGHGDWLALLAVVLLLLATGWRRVGV